MTVHVRATLFVLMFTASLFALSSAYAHAQLDSYVSKTALTLSMSPEHPAPGELTRVEVLSSLFDLAASSMLWYVNGKVVAEGPGISSQNIAAGSAGKETSVRVIVSQEGVGSASVEASVRPVEMDLLWESDSYVPAFYRGRALPSEGASIRFQAVPRFFDSAGHLMPTSEIIFTWKKNGSVLQSVSGRGRAAAIIQGPVLFGFDTFSVEAKTVDGSLSSSASASISSTEPLVELYENNPLLGLMYHQALTGDIALAATEASFFAIPYFAPIQQVNGLQYAWKVNGTPITNNPQRANELTINATGSDGKLLLELALTHATNYFLSSGGSWNILLGGKVGAAAGPNPFEGPNR